MISDRDLERGVGQPVDDDYTGAPPQVDSGKRRVIFTNHAASTSDLFWKSGGDHGFVLQGAVGSGSSVTIDTFVGHKFVWTTTEQADTQQGTAHRSGIEALRGTQVGETIEIGIVQDQHYKTQDLRDEL